MSELEAALEGMRLKVHVLNDQSGCPEGEGACLRGELETESEALQAAHDDTVVPAEMFARQLVVDEVPIGFR